MSPERIKLAATLLRHTAKNDVSGDFIPPRDWTEQQTRDFLIDYRSWAYPGCQIGMPPVLSVRFFLAEQLEFHAEQLED